MIDPGHALPPVAVGLFAAVDRHGEQGFLTIGRVDACGLVDNTQQRGQQQMHMVVRICEFLILFIIPAAHVQLQLRKTMIICQCLQRNIHGIAEVIAHGIVERMAEQGASTEGRGQNRGHRGRGIAASIPKGDVYIVLAVAFEKLCAEHQVVNIGVNYLGGLAAEAFCRGALRRASGLRRTDQKQLLRCLSAAESRLSRHSNDLSNERFSALPVGRDLYLGLIAVRIARHQKVSADAAHRAACGGGGGDLPAFMIQRVVHTADPTPGICACYRISFTVEVVFVCAEFGIVQIDVQRLHLLSCLRVNDLHIKSGEGHIAGILHRENKLGIVTGADAGVAEHSRRHFGGGDRIKGEPGEGLPQIGALAALQIHRVEAGAAVLQLDAVGTFPKLHQAERAISRIGVRIIAHTADQIFLLAVGGSIRSRAFRPVQIHSRAKLDDVKVVRVDLHAVIRDHRGRAAVHQIQCDAFEALDVCAILLLRLIQIEQRVFGVASLKLCIDPEIDDVSLCQHIPAAGGQEGKLAGFI